MLDLHCDPQRTGSRKLTSVCAHYEVALAENEAHTAAADALATARLAWRLGRAHPSIASLDLDELHAAQVRWRAEQAAARQARLRRTSDPAAVVPASWPLQVMHQAA